ncbi:hypothetical protein [Streptomyces sp. CBMA156]|uniref:hypothetical protein n=1 Tax=Streptomyces sp. CBMA156 TaxID=1930280 RepID=UPI001661B722|nr:hypothetical protein [Streptomyces sp. CBMA156]MBD0673989.1 hypothetical protein [Streptomyces sp. CBMA156]
MAKSRLRINLTGKTTKPQDKTVETRPRSRLRINLTGKREETTATLYIGAFESRCGHCGRPTLPTAPRHTDVSGLTPEPGAGCGARFVNIASDSHRSTADDLRRVRPDLPLRNHIA